VLRGLTRFVGRDAEVEHLRRVLGQADAGHGPGGRHRRRSRGGQVELTYGFTNSHRVQDRLILEARWGAAGR
jgi:hypothetical protein